MTTDTGRNSDGCRTKEGTNPPILKVAFLGMTLGLAVLHVCYLGYHVLQLNKEEEPLWCSGVHPHSSHRMRGSTAVVPAGVLES
jgi:hypothetical protein